MVVVHLGEIWYNDLHKMLLSICRCHQSWRWDCFQYSFIHEWMLLYHTSS